MSRRRSSFRKFFQNRTAAYREDLRRLPEVEALEFREMLAVDAAWNLALGELHIWSDGAEPIVISQVGGNIQLNSSITLPTVGARAASSVVRLIVTGGPGNNLIDLSAMSPTSFSSLISVQIVGGDGNDLIKGSFLGDTINGGLGEDTIYAGAGNDLVTSDLLVVDGNDRTFGDAGNDTLQNGAGDDFFDGGSGDDIIDSISASDDKADGAEGRGDDTIYGGDDNDWIDGAEGSDLVAGDAGNDTVDGGEGSDIVLGGVGDDLLYGDEANNGTQTSRDLIIGGAGSDTLYGQRDDDILIDSSSPHDGNPLALLKLHQEWLIADTYEIRTSHLLGVIAGGLNLPFTLDPAAPAFVDDFAIDSLVGGDGRDWFLRDASNNEFGAVTSGEWVGTVLVPVSNDDVLRYANTATVIGVRDVDLLANDANSTGGTIVVVASPSSGTLARNAADDGFDVSAASSVTFTYRTSVAGQLSPRAATVTVHRQVPPAALHLKGDFDGDNRTEVAAFDPVNARIRVTETNNASIADWSTQVSSSSIWLDTLVADVNGDGRDDIVSRNGLSGAWTVWISEGGTFAAPSDWGRADLRGDLIGTKIGDFNGDGRSDLFSFDRVLGDFFIEKSTGVGFEHENWGNISSYLASAASGVDIRFGIGDFDGDGRDDVLVYEATFTTFAFVLSAGTKFTDLSIAPLSGWSTQRAIYFGDFDGDGRDEVLGQRTSTGKFELLEYDGVGTFVVDSDFGNFFSQDSTFFEVADVNRDGRDDLIGYLGHWHVGLVIGSGASTAIAFGDWGNYYDSPQSWVYSGSSPSFRVVDPDYVFEKFFEIFGWIYNNVEYQLYRGQMKGAESTRQTKAGNEWDQVGLLIKELEDAGIQSRYAFGQRSASLVEMASWLGLTGDVSTVAGQQALQRLLVVAEKASTITGSDIQFAHAWAQVYLPGPNGLQWFHVDPAFKMKQYQAGVEDILTLVPYTGTQRDAYLAGVHDHLPWEYYEDQVQNYLRDQFGGTDRKSLADIPHDGPIIARAFSSVPSFNPTSVTLTSDGLPSGADHRVEIRLLRKSDNSQLFKSAVYSVPTVSLKRIAVDYQTLGSNVRPRLLIDGFAVIEDAGLVSPATDVVLEVSHFNPWVASTGTPSKLLTYDRKAGQTLALGLGALQHTPESLRNLRASLAEQVLSQWGVEQPRPGEAVVGGVLSLAMAQYMYNFERQNAWIAGVAHATPIYTTVNSGIATGGNDTVPGGADVEYHWDLEIPAVPKKTSVDIPNLSVLPLSLKDGFYSQDVMRLIGESTSALEHQTVEHVINAASVSTIKGVQLAKQNGEVVYDLIGTDSDNQHAIYGSQTTHAIAVKDKLWQLLGLGYRVIAPQKATAIHDPSSGQWWRGSVYIAEKFETNGNYDLKYVIVGDYTASGGYQVAPPQPAPVIPSRPAAVTAFDPVNVANGSVYRDDTDVSIPILGVPLEFARHYDTTHVYDPATTTAGNGLDIGLGQGWTHSFSDFLEFTRDASQNVLTATWVDRNGHRFSFSGTSTYDSRDADPIYRVSDNPADSATVNLTRGRWFSKPDALTGNGSFKELLQNDGSGETVLGYRRVDRDGKVWEFDRDGRLHRHYDRNSNGVFLTYVSNTVSDSRFRLVSTVRDVNNYATRWLSFTYYTTGPETNRLWKLSDHSGRQWSYQYASMACPDGATRLYLTSVSATGDTATPLPVPSVVSYSHYASGRLLGLVKTIIEPNGGGHEYKYYGNRRSREVIDAAGFRTHSTFDLYRKRTHFYSERDLADTYQYNDDGNLIRKTYDDRTREIYAWNTDARKFLMQSYTDPFGATEAYEYFAETDAVTVSLTVHPLTPPNWAYDPYVWINAQTLIDSGTPELLGDSNQKHATGGLDRILSWQLDLEEEWITLKAINANSFAIPVHPLSLVISGFDSILQGATVDPGLNGFGINSGHISVTAHTLTVSAPDNSLPQVPAYSSLTTRMNLVGPAPVESDRLAQSTDEAGITTAYVWIKQDVDLRGTTNHYPSFWSLDKTTLPADGPGFPLHEVATVYDGYGNAREIHHDTAIGGRDDTMFFTVSDGSSLPRGLVLSEKSPRGESASNPAHFTNYFLYTATGLLTDVTQAGVLRQKNAFNSRGYMDWTKDGTGIQTSFTYDDLGRLVTQTLPDPDGAGPLGSMTTTHLYDAWGQRVRTTDNLGRVTKTTFNLKGQPIQVTYADGTLTALEYDGSGNVIASTDELGRTTRYVYDSRNRRIQTLHPDGSLDQVRYDAEGKIIEVIDPRSNVTRTDYDKAGRIRKTTTAAAIDVVAGSGLGSLVTSFDYDPETGRLSKITDPRGAVKTFEYDGRDRVIKETISVPQSGGGTTPELIAVTHYDANGNINESVQYDVKGLTSIPTDLNTLELKRIRRTATLFDKFDRAEKVTDAEGHFTTTLYDNADRVLQVTDKRGQGTNLDYDDIGRLFTVDRPADDAGQRPRTTTIYDEVGNVFEVIDAEGRTTRFAYDVRNRRIETLAAATTLAAASRVEFDVAGQAVASIDALGRATRVEYDRRGRVIERRRPDPDGIGPGQPNTTRFVYDSAGNVIKEIDALGRETTIEYDALNREVRRILPDPDGSLTTLSSIEYWTSYDTKGNVDEVYRVSAVGGVVHLIRTEAWMHDARRRMTQRTDPDPDGTNSLIASYIDFIYNGFSDVTSQSDQLGRTTDLEYDRLGRLTRETLPAAASGQTRPQTDYLYDPEGNRTQVTERVTSTQSRTTLTEYDNLGRVRAITGHDPGTQAHEIPSKVEFTYDRVGNRLTSKLTISPGEFETTSFEYDDLV